ncbi:uncharacterized protein LOC131937065 [Physella acuta]|uniref:uncharacterized protein LOC131937065 n=1 Tax=Physella acuta TaxID=109671 RepID=UPI0027DBAB43|nr:uncharacterized protein LOC131937065 [Physella acuta]
MDYIILCLLIAAILPTCKADCPGGYFGVGCTQTCKCLYEFECLADGTCPDRFKNGAQFYFFVESQTSHGVTFDAYLVSPVEGQVTLKTYKDQQLDATRSVRLQRQVTKQEALRRGNEFANGYVYHFSATEIEFLVKVFLTDKRNVIQLLRLFEVKTWNRHYHILVTRGHRGALVMSVTSSNVTYSPSLRFNDVIELPGLKPHRITFQWTHLSALRGGCIMSSSPLSVIMLGSNSTMVKNFVASETMMPVNMFGFSWFPFYSEGTFESMFYYVLPGFSETFFTLRANSLSVKRARYTSRQAYYERVTYDKALTSVHASPNPGMVSLLFGPNENVVTLSCAKFLHYRYHFVVPVVDIPNFEQMMMIMSEDLENFRINNYTLTRFAMRGTVSATLKYAAFVINPTDNFIISRSGRVFGCYLYGRIRNVLSFGYIHGVPEPYDFKDATAQPMTTVRPIKDCDDLFYGDGCKTKCNCPHTNVCFQDGRCPLQCPAGSHSMTFCKDEHRIDYFPASISPRALADKDDKTCALPNNNQVDINLVQETYLAGVSIVLEVADEYDSSLYDVDNCATTPGIPIPLTHRVGIPEISKEITLRFVEMQIVKCLRIKIGGKIQICEVKIHGGRSLLYKDADIGTPESTSLISTVDEINKCISNTPQNNYQITLKSETLVTSIAFYTIDPNSHPRIAVVVCVDNDNRLVYHKALSTNNGGPTFFNLNLNVKKIYFEVVDKSFHPCEVQVFGENLATISMYSTNFQEKKKGEGAHVVTGVLLYLLLTSFI